MEEERPNRYKDFSPARIVLSKPGKQVKLEIMGKNEAVVFPLEHIYLNEAETAIILSIILGVAASNLSKEEILQLHQFLAEF